MPSRQINWARAAIYGMVGIGLVLTWWGLFSLGAAITDWLVP